MKGRAHTNRVVVFGMCYQKARKEGMSFVEVYGGRVHTDRESSQNETKDIFLTLILFQNFIVL